MNCGSCGAPLPPKSNICRYCETVNDTDLRGVGRPQRADAASERICPRCDKALVAMWIGDRGFEIDRCDGCMGIFFDPGELERLLDRAVSNVGGADVERIRTLIEEEAPADPAVRYVPCPVCRELMNRKNYATRSGVIIDWCKKDGVWLDGGEVGQLLKWVKAGGKIHQRDVDEEKKRLDEQRVKFKQRLERLDRAAEEQRTDRREGGWAMDALDALFDLVD